MDLSSKEEVRKAASDPRVVFIDVRSHEEVSLKSLKRPYIHAPCVVTECNRLEEEGEKLVPEKDVPIVLFCRSGRRASKAKEVLQGMGYTNIFNAGGITDLDHLFED
uniref:Rhodanese domain-containing protein n=1 Tax=Odontella aurita TaxID=265563 RepID=A0A7S4J1I3_9STRA|mmetsp:Transcript_35546/g.106110  ORF Transcript_35546/g.106110 Transcript_35546/m.106110 type:complete len:107 (+) Transcript_35546:277-597(+)|eukprot:CAMPEP_0113556742 /NCGR_PEP_ID=MMETSP0015_2-20120614/17414_1 /TAXON_ID=2838 /ORGANISM="Odontella" /LENGTH=106 /DNA_ID=CAMNT_0000458109 /DNA_START=277 /DNA_END=597 /DNA_ORIENTATION=+ /assembly_acc=CAM_ASM_000160